MTPLKPKYYDPLKFLTQIVLPALGTLYFALAGIWGLPSDEEVVGTILAIDTFLGVVLQISSSAYKDSDHRFDGTIEVMTTEGGKTGFVLNLPGDPLEIANANEILFKVKQQE